jgi:hypothetical protein
VFHKEQIWQNFLYGNLIFDQWIMNPLSFFFNRRLGNRNMATIDERKDQNGKITYRVQVRIKGRPLSVKPMRNFGLNKLKRRSGKEGISRLPRRKNILSER